ncbi:MAG: hypothetical protein WKG01_03055 [Kofleriaceae bacterium]
MPQAPTHSKDLRRLLRKPSLLVWSVYLVAQPFYVFKSGLPQPGDVLILLLAPVVLYGWNGRLSRNATVSFKPLLWFTLWVCLVDFSWMVILGKYGLGGMSESMLLMPVYQIYNTTIVLVALVLYQRFGNDFLRLTVWVVFLIALFLVASSFVLRSSSYRGTLYFANPNQLGYYALLSACIIGIAQRRIQFATLYSAIGLSACAYLGVVSASRSALSGIALLVVFLVFSNLRVIILASAAAILLLLVGGPIADSMKTSQERMMMNRTPHLTFFEERGYDRIAAHKEYLLLGAGEGFTNRFKETTIIGASEIHSSAGTLVFCYGIVGVFLFGRFLWRTIRGAPLMLALMLAPPLIYTFAHQGLRFTLLWVLLPMFIVVARQPNPNPPLGRLVPPNERRMKTATP